MCVCVCVCVYVCVYLCICINTKKPSNEKGIYHMPN